ncbi:Cytoskeleton-associated protein 5 [Porphyridium purpureum]|uniref:Cytoskeleton-associated protein 5 n=1 Tax=Porphyridium purpureum TaxID=35688 RepID=A0A5J4YJ74_PORPP|nr:Cytoskeleton-associated protein 5 [Porphyridium purpureum]|eukprot:POR3750..scf210_14
MIFTILNLMVLLRTRQAELSQKTRPITTNASFALGQTNATHLPPPSLEFPHAFSCVHHRRTACRIASPVSRRIRAYPIRRTALEPFGVYSKTHCFNIHYIKKEVVLLLYPTGDFSRHVKRLRDSNFRNSRESNPNSATRRGHGAKCGARGRGVAVRAVVLQIDPTHPSRSRRLQVSMGADEDDVVQQAAALPMPQRLAHKNWKVRQSAYEHLERTFSSASSSGSVEELQRLRSEYAPSASSWVRDANAAAQLQALVTLDAFAQVLASEIKLMLPSFQGWDEMGASGISKMADDVASAVCDKALTARPQNKQRAYKVIAELVYAECGKPALAGIFRSGFKSKQPKVVEGAVLLVRHVTQTFGTRALDLAVLFECVPALLEHSNAGVRDAAKNLMGDVFKYFPHRDAMVAVLRDSKEATRKEVETLMVSIDEQRSSTPFTPERRTCVDEHAAISAEAGNAHELNVDGTVNEHTVPADAPGDGFALLPQIDLLEKLQTVKIAADEDVMVTFRAAVEHSKWSVRKNAIDSASSICQGMRLKPDADYSELTTLLKKGVAKDVNINVAAAACQLIEALAHGLRSDFDGQMAKSLFVALLGRLKDKNKTLLNALSQALFTLHHRHCVSLDSVHAELLEAFRAKQPQMRERAALWVEQCLGTYEQDHPQRQHVSESCADAWFKPLLSALLSAMDDSSKEVRDAVFKALARVRACFGERAVANGFHDMDVTKMARITEFGKEMTTMEPSASRMPSKAPASTSTTTKALGGPAQMVLPPEPATAPRCRSNTVPKKGPERAASEVAHVPSFHAKRVARSDNGTHEQSSRHLTSAHKEDAPVTKAAALPKMRTVSSRLDAAKSSSTGEVVSATSGRPGRTLQQQRNKGSGQVRPMPSTGSVPVHARDRLVPSRRVEVDMQQTTPADTFGPRMKCMLKDREWTVRKDALESLLACGQTLEPGQVDVDMMCSILDILVETFEDAIAGIACDAFHAAGLIEPIVLQSGSAGVASGRKALRAAVRRLGVESRAPVQSAALDLLQTCVNKGVDVSFLSRDLEQITRGTNPTVRRLVLEWLTQYVAAVPVSSGKFGDALTNLVHVAFNCFRDKLPAIRNLTVSFLVELNSHVPTEGIFKLAHGLDPIVRREVLPFLESTLRTRDGSIGQGMPSPKPSGGIRNSGQVAATCVTPSVFRREAIMTPVSSAKEGQNTRRVSANGRQRIDLDLDDHGSTQRVPSAHAFTTPEASRTCQVPSAAEASIADAHETPVLGLPPHLQKIADAAISFKTPDTVRKRLDSDMLEGNSVERETALARKTVAPTIEMEVQSLLLDLSNENVSLEKQHIAMTKLGKYLKVGNPQAIAKAGTIVRVMCTQVELKISEVVADPQGGTPEMVRSVFVPLKGFLSLFQEHVIRALDVGALHATMELLVQELATKRAEAIKERGPEFHRAFVQVTMALVERANRTKLYSVLLLMLGALVTEGNQGRRKGAGSTSCHALSRRLGILLKLLVQTRKQGLTNKGTDVVEAECILRDVHYFFLAHPLVPNLARADDLLPRAHRAVVELVADLVTTYRESIWSKVSLLPSRQSVPLCTTVLLLEMMSDKMNAGPADWRFSEKDVCTWMELAGAPLPVTDDEKENSGVRPQDAESGIRFSYRAEKNGSALGPLGTEQREKVEAHAQFNAICSRLGGPETDFHFWEDLVRFQKEHPTFDCEKRVGQASAAFQHRWREVLRFKGGSQQNVASRADMKREEALLTQAVEDLGKSFSLTSICPEKPKLAAGSIAVDAVDLVRASISDPMTGEDTAELACAKSSASHASGGIMPQTEREGAAPIDMTIEEREARLRKLEAQTAQAARTPLPVD